MPDEQELTDWQQRVIDEREGLAEKLSKLDDFLADASRLAQLTPDERGRLGRQANHMQDYLAVLDERIEAFS